MYRINNKKQFKFPLSVAPFAERYNDLIKNDNKKKVVYIKNEFDNSTFRYRCYNLKQSLKSSKKYTITYFTSDEIQLITDFLDKVSIIILQRASFNIDIVNLIFYAQKHKICVVYDMDDMFYNVDYAIKYINHIGRDYDLENVHLYFGMAAAYDKIAEKCNCFISTTNHLKRKLESDFKRKCFVIKNYLNNEQIIESNYILKNKRYDESKFIIGYFSGSPSHQNDFRVVENALLNLMEKYDNIYLKIVGFMELNPKFIPLKQKKRIIIKDLVPYQELQYEIGEVDLNIVSLADIDFNKAKSELKYFEAAIVKVPSCVSKGNIYDSIITNFEDGVLCDNDNWEENIEKLYLNRKLLKKIEENAYKKACKLYLPEKQKENIEKVYDEILKEYNNEVVGE